MALISVSKAAARIGVPDETLRDWVQRGLLPLHPAPAPSGSVAAKGSVGEEEFADRVESRGWLQLSSEHGDAEEE
jgi:transposase-like protein